uniref:Uncharacterized protein n=1 Tax=Hyaloperonospora arabidopsidis (strain Emoy2) TaxID=559515 RepID=M4BM36_HYAAE
MLIEKMKRIAEVEECVTAIRAIARKSQLSQDDIGSVIRRMLDEEDFFDGGIDTKSTVLEDLCAHIFQTGGRLDFRKHRLEVLVKVLCSLEEVQAGRSDVLNFLHRIVEEAAMLTHDVALSGHGDDIFCHFTSPLPPISQGDQSFVDTLAAGKEILCCLSEPVEGALRSLLYSMDNDFAAFGIDTKEHRMSFFLGCRVEDKSSRLAILDKYVIHSSCAAKTLSNDGNSDIGVLGRALECNGSFLSRLDPAFEEFHWTYSVSFGDSQLQRLRTSIADIREVKNAMVSAQIRLKSLRKIMVIYNKINEFKSKIAEFEASASQKDRLFGNSLVLLEEERFRKMAAKHYPNLLAALQKEVSRWLENEGGEYDLSVLGEDLKNLLLDMMNTNTDLMHLDLGIVSRASKQMMTPTSSSATVQATATGSNQRTTSKIATPSRNNVRNQSSNEHEAFQL